MHIIYSTDTSIKKLQLIEISTQVIRTKRISNIGYSYKIEIFRNSEKNEHKLLYVKHHEETLNPISQCVFFLYISLIIITQSFLKVNYFSTLGL